MSHNSKYSSLIDLPFVIQKDLASRDANVYNILIKDAKFYKQLTEQDKRMIKNGFKSVKVEKHGKVTSTIHYLNNRRHRDDDLPAVESDDGGKQWWRNGVRHRDNDKHAVILGNGTKYRYTNGVLGDLNKN